MEIAMEKYYPNPREKANPLSIVFFGYSFGMFKKGFTKTLDVDDLYDPLKKDRSKVLGEKLQRNWEKQLEKSKGSDSKPSFLKALVATFWVEYALFGVILIITDLVLKVSQPIVLGLLLQYFRPGTAVTKQDALLYAGLIVFINCCNVILSNQHIFGLVHGGMRVRAACCAVIYRKALKLSTTALGDTSCGKIVNLLSNDVSRFDIVSLFFHQMWAAPAGALITIIILYIEAGVAGITGVIVVLFVMVTQAYTGKLSAKYRKQTAQKTDERVRLMDEIVSGIQVIKMYAWEIPFKKVIQAARNAEIKIVTKSSHLRGILMGFNLFTTRFALFCTLLTFVLTSEKITAAKVFVITSYFNIISMSLANVFTRGISEMAELFVAVKRIRDFLLKEEYDPTKAHLHMNGHSQNVDVKNIIRFKDLTVKWNLNYKDNALENINLNIPVGHLIGIIGPVGCGKSSLLQTILGELAIVHGDMKIGGSLSYASQDPWVFSATIRQNIVFGQQYDKKRYQEVIQVCALERDFEQFVNGDLTVVGDRGASLSGGQKARINLARAVYREADIYLLDDPLSAVDIHVSKVLYEKCINGYLANKTRILVTHQVFYLKNADFLYILNNGRIEDEGDFKSLTKTDNVYAQLLTSEPENTEVPEKVAKPEQPAKPDQTRCSRQSSVRSRRGSYISQISQISQIDVVEIALSSDLNDDLETSDEEKEVKFNIKDLQEGSSKGKVKGNLLIKYFSSGAGILATMFLMVLFLGTQILVSGVDYWVSDWVNIEELRNETINGTVAEPMYFASIELTTYNCIYIYCVLLGALFILAMVRSAIFYQMAMVSSKKLHKIIFDNVIGATMRFFDTNPAGRILNRFSKDIGGVDELLPKTILDALQNVLTMIGSFILIAIINPYFLIIIGFLGILFGLLRYIYLKSSKNIKRLEGMMKSPVFTHLKATLDGLNTIRAFEAQNILMQEFDNHQDHHSSAWYMFIVASTTFGFYLEILCACFTALVTFSFLGFEESLNFKSGDVGLAITQATSLTVILQWAIRQSAEVSNQLMSVERVLEYKDLPKEIQPATPQTPPDNWPQNGEILFTNTCLRYFEKGPLVLNRLNLNIKPKEKVGVVGRTGAGKSSIIQALFRLAPIEGGIRIDDVDTKDISLDSLRQKISIIPQDPVLYSGTLRYNLDPFEQYTDAALNKAIEDVELKDPANIINSLKNKVMDRGSNYSVGQRQLICLARAILKNNKVLMLDEATANVDPQTDALIQKTIRRKFKECTVITVAHRLNTIMDSDKVLVMDAGRVAEFDHPHLLLQNKNGVFYHMVMETGKATSQQLTQDALNSYKRVFDVPE